MARADEGRPAERRNAATVCVSTAVLLTLFLAYSLICRPIPSVNEPHYLTKAKHYWQPQWCAGDFFLESSNPHLVFYQTIGALTQWLTLPQTAWAGRVIALALLAWGWTRLVLRLSTCRGAVVGSGCLLLLLQALGNVSGEWLVGGIESKVISYALVFAGWASLLDMRLLPAAVGLGVAISFHPVVGGWCLIATGMALIAGAIVDRRRTAEPAALSTPTATVSVTSWIAASLLLTVCALPGLLPAVQSLAAADTVVAERADFYQVGVRLKHHLDPQAFGVPAYRYYGLLLLLWLLLRRPGTQSPARRLFDRIVLASLVIAGVGILIGWGPRPIDQMPLARLRVWLLKFYPFRLADLLVPVLLSVVMFERVQLWAQAQPAGSKRRVGVLVAAAAFGLSLWIPDADRSSSRMTPAQQADWIAACEWIRRETPEAILLYAANEDWAVKWFAHRAEYVNYKDCPQDAAGILEWVRRLRTLNRWHRSAFVDGRLSEQDLQELHAQTGITHLLVSRLGPIDSEPVYRNGSFRIHQLSAADR
jgi:hypothetical protein